VGTALKLVPGGLTLIHKCTVLLDSKTIVYSNRRLIWFAVCLGTVVYIQVAGVLSVVPNQFRGDCFETGT
jgi:hypothetical protein